MKPVKIPFCTSISNLANLPIAETTVTLDLARMGTRSYNLVARAVDPRQCVSLPYSGVSRRVIDALRAGYELPSTNAKIEDGYDYVQFSNLDDESYAALSPMYLAEKTCRRMAPNPYRSWHDWRFDAPVMPRSTTLYFAHVRDLEAVRSIFTRMQQTPAALERYAAAQEHVRLMRPVTLTFVKPLKVKVKS